jgi:hypothetical protein
MGVGGSMDVGGSMGVRVDGSRRVNGQWVLEDACGAGSLLNIILTRTSSRRSVRRKG